MIRVFNKTVIILPCALLRARRAAPFAVARRVCLSGWLLFSSATVAAAQYRVDFEGPDETKTAYAAGNVMLSGLEWSLTQALIGELDQDKKNGARSLRIRRSGDNAGVAEMLQDKNEGIGWMAFEYAGYGNDIAQPSLYVEYSIDAGSSWQQAGETIVDFPQTLSRWAAVLNVHQPARIRLRTGLDGTNERRINIDDIVLSDPGRGPPLVVTEPVASIKPDGAMVGGRVHDEGGGAVTARGVVWNKTGNPSTDDNMEIVAGTGTNVFALDLSGLISGQVYYVCAFAQNSEGIGYGDVKSFTTASFTGAPVLHPEVKRHQGGFAVHWDRVAGAREYLIEIASDTRFHPGGEGAVFYETMGVVSAATSIGNHHAAGGFDYSSDHDFCEGGAGMAADVRGTLVSSGYTNAAGNPASGGANIWFTSIEGDYGFCISGIDPRSYTDLRLSFGYRKQAADANALLAVDWSDDQGATWHPLEVTGLPEEDASTGWYLVENLPLPAAAQEADKLALRWIKSGATAMRLDDVLLWGNGGAATLHPRLGASYTDQTAYRADRVGAGEWWVRVRAVGAGDSASPYSEPRRVAVGGGATVMVIE